ncbi:hypothetical protein CCAX7_13450 [Capsulimonas corticalis]|uniref:Uncharacterized protein n=1 Tax=Capsulimonas corticalis TaxID=2219043 RepID=A0A402D4P4_9BACT|nr:hypothetical protein [Capsulimonas corticalis]BDI29294.1 hypothetical protein CCAX7_13450 [Capsulimonas corticalis]
MSKGLPLISVSELGSNELKNADFIEAAYQFAVSTPSHVFTDILADAFNDYNYILVISRDMFDKDLASTVIQFVRKNNTILDVNKPLTILPGLQHPSYGFDTIFLINCEVHGLFKGDNMDVYLRTIQAIPAYHCEFNSNDDIELVRYVRSRFVSTLDWKRSPAPRVWFKFNNKITNSIGKKMGITSIDHALQEVLRIAEYKTGWAEFKNYLDEHIRLDYEGNSYLISIPARQPISLPEDEITSWITSYLIDGLEQVLST